MRPSMVHRVITLNVRNRAGAIALAVMAVVLGGTLLAFGLVLLAGLAVTGAVVGAGVMLYYKLTGRLPGRFSSMQPRGTGLDPAQEVFPLDTSERRLRAPEQN